MERMTRGCAALSLHVSVSLRPALFSLLLYPNDTIRPLWIIFRDTSLLLYQKCTFDSNGDCFSAQWKMTSVSSSTCFTSTYCFLFEVTRLLPAPHTYRWFKTEQTAPLLWDKVNKWGLVFPNTAGLWWFHGVKIIQSSEIYWKPAVSVFSYLFCTDF